MKPIARILGEQWDDLAVLEQYHGQIYLRMLTLRREARQLDIEHFESLKDECLLCGSPTDWGGRGCGLTPRGMRTFRQQYEHGNGIFSSHNFPSKKHNHCICDDCLTKRVQAVARREAKDRSRVCTQEHERESRSQKAREIVEDTTLLIGVRFRELGFAYSHVAREELSEMPYREFLQTLFWKTVSVYVKSRRQACQLCGSKQDLNVHHSTYDHRGWEDHYWESDLVILCRECHRIYHKEEIEKDGV